MNIFNKLITFSILLFGIICLFAIMVNVIIAPSHDTTVISNVGVLLLLALGNACFSWARSITDEERAESIKHLNDDGAACIMAGLSFGVGSLTKYVFINASIIELNGGNFTNFKNLVFLGCCISMLTAFIITVGVSWSIVRTYHKMKRF